jgi:SulP family sulfate permease
MRESRHDHAQPRVPLAVTDEHEADRSDADASSDEHGRIAALRNALAAYPIMRPKKLLSRKTIKDDGMAGLVLGVESVPDSLASGLLAGVNPVYGLYGYLYGMVGGALFTSTAYMAVQATGAMSIIVADVDLAGRDDPARSLFTLSIATGLVMIVAGLLRLGTLLRFVSNSVMTGFITAVGVNIVLGQLGDFTGYDASGSGRITRALDTLLHFWEIELATIIVGLVTVVLIVVLQRTALGALGLVVAIAAGSALAAVMNAFERDVALVSDIADVPGSLPFITAPVITELPGLLIPAASLAFVGLVQGAGVSAGFPNQDGSASDVSQDFVGQGAGNLLAGFFQGMPVGGSMSASSLVSSAGAKTRGALLFAGVTMALIVLLLSEVVAFVAMPSLAGLLMVIGVTTIKPHRIIAVAHTGSVPMTVMGITLVLTLVIPLQYSVLVGVGISVILFVVGQSSRLKTKRLLFREDGRVELVEPPEAVPAGEVVVLQPYGTLFFATAQSLKEQLPTVVDDTKDAVVILRLRGSDDADATVMDVLKTYAAECREQQSRLAIVTDSKVLVRQMELTGVAEETGPERIYTATRFVGEATRRAYDDATLWVERRRAQGSADVND